MQYIILAVVFSKGAPYRLPMHKNWTLLASVTAITLLTFYLILGPSIKFQEFFELVIPPKMDFRVVAVALCCVNFLLAGIHEFFICDYLIFYKLRARWDLVYKSINLCLLYVKPSKVDLILFTEYYCYLFFSIVFISCKSYIFLLICL